MVSSIDEFTQQIGSYSEQEQAEIRNAANWASEMHKDQLRASGEPYIIHPLNVANFLIQMRMDAPTVIAALLHDVLEDTDIGDETLKNKFGEEIYNLVDGVTKIDIIHVKNKSVQETETIRKMFFAMVKDIRVILIKLADKLHNMHTLEHLKEERRKTFATETLDIYAPLAGRLGISWLKDELEDLSLKHLRREVYSQIKAAVSQKKSHRSEYLKRVQDAIIRVAGDMEIQVSTRAKHFYSVYQKMKKRNKNIDEIYDLLGIRILCRTESDCYTVLGHVHKLWRPIEGRFKDYIANPKANKYQSLHTTVMCYEGKLIEIQIRTFEMHETAEYGIAAHWLYKKKALNPATTHKDLSLVKQLENLKKSRITSSEFLGEIKGEILKDSIFVFTPAGDIIELPKGATAIDFAYHIHTEVGNHLVGAKADDHIIPLKEELKNTQAIEVITAPSAHPRVNWLRHVKTSRARSKIRNWLNKHDDSVIINKSIVARQKQETPQKPKKTPPKQVKSKNKIGVRIGDERNMMIRFGRCCSPATGDAIVGYVSRGRGIIIHRKDCKNLRFIEGIEDREVEVEWETVSPKVNRRFRIEANQITDLFSSIERAVRKCGGHLLQGAIDDNLNEQIVAHFTMELESSADVKKVVKLINNIPAITLVTLL